MKTDYEIAKQKIKHIKDTVKKQAANIVVLLVINTDKKNEVNNDYEGFSVQSEYFSEKELVEVINGFKELGCLVDFSNGEKEFIEKLVNNKFRKYSHLRKIVYHSTGSGTGKSRSALTPALCNLYNIENCSNDIYTSVISENKVHLFNLLDYYGYPIPRTWYYDEEKKWFKGEPVKNKLLIAKPAYESSSIGVSVDSVSMYSAAFRKHVKDLSHLLGQPILVQEFIEGFEVEVPVFDIGEPFTPMSVGIKLNGRKNLGNQFLTYESVSEDKYGFYSFSKEMPELGARLKKIASDSFAKLNLNGMMRVDFRVSSKGKYFIMDYNNTPHLTQFHSCAFSITNLGFKYSDMFALLLFKHIGVESAKAE
ncbi:MAG TPA: ATP-grasp domain-containing protein [Bacteroidia bacterium]